MKRNLHFLKNYSGHIINIMMIILGSLGLVGNYYHSLGFPESVLISLLILCMMGIGFYYYFVKYQIMPKKIAMIIIIVLLLGMILLFQNELTYFIDALQTVIERDYFLNFDELLPTDMYSRSLFFQMIFLFIGLPIIYLIVSSICSRHFSFMKILSMIFLFMFPVFIRHELTSLNSYCFIIFICFQFLFTVALKYTYTYTFKGMILSLLCVMSLVASSYMEGNPIFQQETSSVLFQITDWFSHGKGNPFGNFLRTGMSGDIDGSLPTGNIQLSHSLALTVQANNPFSSYLRAYSLANYSDNEWHEVTENYENSHSLTIYSEFLRLNSSLPTQNVEITTQRQYDFQFVPYYLMDQEQQYPVLYDSYIEQTNYPLEVIYQNVYYYGEGYYFVGYDDDYEEYVKRHYLDVPEELSMQLSDFLAENGIDDSIRFDALSAVEIIRNLLASQAEYDLNAGTLPNDKDFVEYFLFENRKGSCTHFATAGALLLRELGIPTRFVRGYTMLASDFDNGVAKIPQYRSHAWIEVYEEGKGWIPYEMTPTGNIEGISTLLDDTVSQNQQTSNNSQTPTIQPDQEIPQNTTDNPFIPQESTSSYPYIEIIVQVAVILIFIIVYRYITTHWLMLKTRCMNNNQKVLTYYQQRLKLTSQHQIDDDECKAIAYKAKYSSHKISDEEWLRFYELYQQWIQEYDRSLKWYQKLIFRYVLGYK